MVEQEISSRKADMYSDSPIKDAKRFNFEAYSNVISKIILQKDNETPFSIAINGKWGSGKTTLMKTLREKLRIDSGKGDNRKVRSVWFNAWKYSDLDSMLAALIFEIFEEMGNAGLIDKLKAIMVGGKKINLIKELSDTIKLFTSGHVEFDKWFENQEYKEKLSFYNTFQDYMKTILITFVLEKEGNKYNDKEGILVIFIDDLDRCPPKQITKVLESINLFFDQEGCFFVFGADISLISKAIDAEYKEIKEFSGIDYVKKMIQLQFDLPAIDERDILDFMEKELNIENQLKIYFEIIIKGLESNQREIKRFLNSLNLMRMLSDFIKIRGYDDELLIKWCILNFSSKEFIKEVNINPEFMIKMEDISSMEKSKIDEYIETLDEPYKKLCSEFIKKEKIVNILRCGEKKFRDADIAGYIFLSSIAPKEPKEITIEAESEKKLGVSLARLPSTNPELFGREKELNLLDEAWSNPKTNIICFVAWGGVGKTALVNSWLGRMGGDNFRGAQRVFGWSFYSQGALEGKQASADEFIASALKWFGDPKPDAGSPWDKGERLAEYVKKQKTLLILDGIEPLQHYFREQEGKIKDPGLATLVRELAHDNPGLCVITTRLDVDDIRDLIGTAVEIIHLENLSDEAGLMLLKHLGVKGSDDEIKQAVRDFGGHALSLMLLGNYLSKVYKGDVRKRDRISTLTKEIKYGNRTKGIMESYEIQFKGQPELDVLNIMGLFDKPAEGGAVAALRADPPIKELTSHLIDVSFEKWQFMLDNLRKAGLLTKEDPTMPDILDCHPLIREHFGEKLKKNYPEAWKEAHSRLYEYYKGQAKELPDTIEEMMPLYAAVAHGCWAGRYQEALVETYWPRILRRGENFSWRKLGSFGADLAAISGFFDEPWSKVTAELSEDDKGFILNGAGFALRALGRLAEAAQPMKAGLDAYIAQENWKNAAMVEANLSELSLTTGDIALALKYADQSIDMADRSGDTFERMSNRTRLADVMHQAGRLREAETAFHEAEKIQKEMQPEYPLLYSLQGFRYCDLLLAHEKYQDVLSRAEQTFKIAESNKWLLDIALDHLSLGRAHHLRELQEKNGDFTQASEHLNQAVDWLRKSGDHIYIPRGLLARADLYRVQGSFDKAHRDLDEAMTIAERGEMGLHQADCRLGYARLYLAMGEKEKAREHFAEAKEMIAKMGYHRRDGEVEEIENKLEEKQ